MMKRAWLEYKRIEFEGSMPSLGRKRDWIAPSEPKLKPIFVLTPAKAAKTPLTRLYLIPIIYYLIIDNVIQRN